MTQVSIDDAIIKNARAVTGIKNDKAIVEEALQSFILDMKAQSAVKQYYGKLNWDTEFAGVTLDREANSDCSRHKCMD